MAQLSQIYNGAPCSYTLPNLQKPHTTTSLSSLSFRSSQLRGSSVQRLANCRVGKVHACSGLSFSYHGRETIHRSGDNAATHQRDVWYRHVTGFQVLINRIPLLAALSEGTTVVDNLLSSDDIHYMIDALRTLGLRVEENRELKRAVMEGCSGQFPVGKESKTDIELFLGNAGTAMLPLTAAVTAAGGNSSYILDGVPRMRERPIGDLILGLQQLGADVSCSPTDCPPVHINAKGGLPGGKGDVKFAEVLEKMGAKVRWTETSVTVTGPAKDSFGQKQLHAIDVNMNKMPDVAMTLAVVALLANGSTAIRDVASWRVKETERMVAICTELRKLGAIVEEGPDYCVITPPEKLSIAEIDTYDDHRMAMAFSLAACGEVPVTIKDPGCTRKTFPDYFQVLERFTKH